MSWIRTTVKTMHLVVLLVACGISIYSLSVTGQEAALADKEQNVGALAVVPDSDSSQQEQDDDGAVVEIEDEIIIENPEPFIPTSEWQTLKPGQAIPSGLHVRLNMQTGEKEARLLHPQTEEIAEKSHNTEGNIVGDKISFDEMKKAVKSMKSEKVKNVDMETLQKERKLRTYDELKAEMVKMNADIKTDTELVTELAGQLQTTVKSQEDAVAVLQQLEYYLHQIDNAVLFCDLGAMPALLHCLNTSRDNERSEAAMVLGAALQSNPQVQINAMENGAMHTVLRLVAFDPSPAVRKRAMHALSALVRHFPFAQKSFLQQGGLSVLAQLFHNHTHYNLQVRAVTLLTDLIWEKELHSVLSDAEDSAQQERLRQYEEIDVKAAMFESGWCKLIPSLLAVREHDSREKVLTAMEAVLPVCRDSMVSAKPVLRELLKEYQTLQLEEQRQSDRCDDVGDDGFFQSMVTRLIYVINGLYACVEL